MAQDHKVGRSYEKAYLFHQTPLLNIYYSDYFNYLSKCKLLVFSELLKEYQSLDKYLKIKTKLNNNDITEIIIQGLVILLTLSNHRFYHNDTNTMSANTDNQLNKRKPLWRSLFQK